MGHAIFGTAKCCWNNVMSDDAFDTDKLIDVMSAFLNLPIEPAYRKGVAVHLLASQRIAKSFLELPLHDDAEPAPVFCP
jgi:Protein of unknown function (DUF4089)